jgi:exosortase/archaeosortase family protein
MPWLTWTSALAAVLVGGVALEWAALQVAPVPFSLETAVIPALCALGVLVRPRQPRTWWPGWGVVAVVWGMAALVVGLVGWVGPGWGLWMAPGWLGVAAWVGWGPRHARDYVLLWSCGWVPAVLSPPVGGYLDRLLVTWATGVNAAVLRVMGFSAYVDGHTVGGLGVPIYVTEACAGATIMVGAYVLGVVIASLTTARGLTQLVLGVGFVGVAMTGNVARMVAISATAGWAGREAATEAHDVIGYVTAGVGWAVLGVLVVVARRLERSRGVSAVGGGRAWRAGRLEAVGSVGRPV